jgi:hypothetical protein
MCYNAEYYFHCGQRLHTFNIKECLCLNLNIY